MTKDITKPAVQFCVMFHIKCAILILLQPVITCTSVEVLLIVRKELFTGSFIDAEKIVVAHEAVSMMVPSRTRRIT